MPGATIPMMPTYLTVPVFLHHHSVPINGLALPNSELNNHA
jgi:hypothetical protein